MRSLVLAVSLLVSLHVHAAASVRLYTNQTRVSTAHELAVFVQNDGTEPILEARVRIELNPDLEFRGAIQTEGGWICGIVEKRDATCRLPSFAVGAHHAFRFRVMTTRSGQFNVHTTVSGQNLPHVPRIIINVVDNTRIVVTTPSDFGAGSLREAIEIVNDDPLCGTVTVCRILFAGPMTITPSIPLPPIRKCNVEIIGGEGIEPADQPKAIVISGENATWGNGLEVRASCGPHVPGVTLKSLVVHSWPWNGIYFEAPEPHGGSGIHTILYSYIGLNPMGLEARPNRGRGVVTDSPYERVSIISTLVSGNGRSGVAFFRGEQGSVSGGKIGINRHHQPLGNGASGIFSFGVPLAVGGSIVAYNAHAGVSIARGTARASVTASEIHSNGGLPIDWGLDGRTPPDDESDGILNAPRILDAVYDPSDNSTRIRGTVRVRKGPSEGPIFQVQSYLASSERGDVVDWFGSGYQRVDPHVEGPSDEPFEILIVGDLRGKLIALQTVMWFAARGDYQSSEISEAVRVR